MRSKFKKLIVALVITGLFISMSGLKVQATTATATAIAELKASSKKVKPGDTFTVTLNVTSEQNLNGVITEFAYDEQKLELEEKKIGAEWQNWSDSDSKEITLMYNSGTDSKTSDVCIMTFKVKTGATGTASISTSKIHVDTMEAEEGIDLESKKVEVEIEAEQGGGEKEEKTLTSIEITTLPTKTTYTEGEKFSTAGMKVTAKYSDGTSKEITNYTANPSTALKTTDKKIVISYTEGKETVQNEVEITVKAKSTGDSKDDKNTVKVTTIRKDNTVADKEYPKTGVERVVLPIILLAVISGIAYIVNRKYKKI